jgi:hypothetical protein
VVQRGSSATSVAEAEQRFRQYDVTEDGWLSGTELDACRCRGDDVNRDGEVTKAEFLAAATRTSASANRGGAGGATGADLQREAERLFARYDVTEGGWLSGTELTACGCLGDDASGDGEVTKAEFVSAYVRRGGAPAVRASERGSTPARPVPTNAAPEVAERSAPPAARDEGSPVRDGVPLGKYNCYAYGAGRPMPWEPGFGGMAEAPRATTQYVMNLTVGEGGTYQYLNRGRGSYSLDARTGMITWRSGPFAGSGIKAAFRQRTGQRPVIYLDLEGTRASCLGPQQ